VSQQLGRSSNHKDILKTKKLKVFKQEVEILNGKLQEKERRVNELDNMMVNTMVPSIG